MKINIQGLDDNKAVGADLNIDTLFVFDIEVGDGTYRLSATEDGALEINAGGRNYHLLIAPRSTNVVQLRCE